MQTLCCGSGWMGAGAVAIRYVVVKWRFGSECNVVESRTRPFKADE
jgi:hypothetical protein